MRYEEKNEAGRVVDLRKIVEKEKKPESKPEKKSKGGFFVFSLFRKKEKTHRVDFYKHYKNLEKKDEFIEREILKEYLDDEDEAKKHSALTSFFDFFTRVLKLWWLPLFIIRFIWILFWRVGKFIFFRKENKIEKLEKKIFGKKIVATKIKEVMPWNAKDISLETAARSGSGKMFWRSLWAIPGETKDYLLGCTTADYFYQRILAKEIHKKKFHPLRHLFSFVFLLFIFIFPIAGLNYYNVIDLGNLRSRILGVSERAFGDLQSAAASVSDMDLNQASQSFGAAAESFKEANDNLSQINDVLFELGKVVPNNKIKLAAQSREILAAGADASSLGNNLTLAVNSFFNKDSKNLSQMIDDFVSYETLAIADAQKLNKDVAQINVNVLPEEYRKQFVSLKQKGNDLEEILTKNVDLVKKINLFLGRDSDKRYLLVFENNSEMRASGGFIGSYALADLSRGKITNIEAPGGGSYDTAGGLKMSITAPEPLYLVNPLWHFWDANWWPDWQKSAKKLTWFYEKSGGPTTDGVIAFTPTVLERILQTIGPIDMTDTQGVVMTSDNLWDNLRLIIEKEKISDAQLPYTLQENKPKKVVGELMQRIMAELPGRIDRQKLSELLSGLETDLSEKQILFYFKDADLQAEAESRNWAGRIKETNKDYLMVVNTNIAGGKSDRKMEENIHHQAAVQEDGSIIDTVTIKRTHTGAVDDQFSGVRNVDWMRIYVPYGSELLEADGFRGPDPIYFTLPEADWQTDSDVLAEEGDNAIIDRDHLNTKIYIEEGKTVFANWSMVDPGNTATITLKYRLPFKLEKPVKPVQPKTRFDIFLDKMIKTEKKDYLVYSFLAQKQAGLLHSSIENELILPEDFKIAWKFPEIISTDLDYWQDSSVFDTDKYWAAVIEKIVN